MGRLRRKLRTRRARVTLTRTSEADLVLLPKLVLLRVVLGELCLLSQRPCCPPNPPALPPPMATCTIPYQSQALAQAPTPVPIQAPARAIGHPRLSTHTHARAHAHAHASCTSVIPSTSPTKISSIDLCMLGFICFHTVWHLRQSKVPDEPKCVLRNNVMATVVVPSLYHGPRSRHSDRCLHGVSSPWHQG